MITILSAMEPLTQIMACLIGVMMMIGSIVAWKIWKIAGDAASWIFLGGFLIMSVGLFGM